MMPRRLPQLHETKITSRSTETRMHQQNIFYLPKHERAVGVSGERYVALTLMALQMNDFHLSFEDIQRDKAGRSTFIRDRSYGKKFATQILKSLTKHSNK